MICFDIVWLLNKPSFLGKSDMVDEKNKHWLMIDWHLGIKMWILAKFRREKSEFHGQKQWPPTFHITFEVFRNFRKMGLNYNDSNYSSSYGKNSKSICHIWAKLRFIFFISSGEDRAMRSRLKFFSGLSFFWALQLGWEEKVVLIFKDEFRFRFTINFKTCKQ